MSLSRKPAPPDPRDFSPRRRCARPVVLSVLLTVCGGCHSDMYDQPRYGPLESSDFFGDGQSARTPVEGTVARGELREDEAFYKGKTEGQFVTELPLELDRPLLERGRERFEIYCAMCHDLTGQGNGIIVSRGFRRPPSFHIDRLREAPIGHYFDVITNGFGAMPSYAVQIEPRDRWAIAAYIRALQLSRNATPADRAAQSREPAP